LKRTNAARKHARFERGFFMKIAIGLIAAIAAAGFATGAAAQPQGPCFYVLPNFQGQSFCIQPNQRVPALAALNDRLMSVRIPPGMRVTMCSDTNFQGRCAAFTESIPSFATMGAAGQVSSVISEAAGPGGPRPGPAAGAPPPGAGGPPRVPQFDRGDPRARMFELRERCEDGDTRACVRFGIIIGENRERRAQWAREHPELFWWER
jgi:hypothetical protein